MKKALCVALWCAIGISIGACDKKDSGAEAKPGEAAKSPGGAEPVAAKLEFKKLGDLAIEAEVPADAKIDDKSKTAGFPSVTIWANPTTFVTGQSEMMWPKDFEAAKRRVEQDPNKLQQYTKEDAKDDGTFHLEFTREAMTNKQPLYGVMIRTKLGDSFYDCGSNAKSEDERAKVIAICSSLRAVL